MQGTCAEMLGPDLQTWRRRSNAGTQRRDCLLQECYNQFRSSEIVLAQSHWDIVLILLVAGMAQSDQISSSENVLAQSRWEIVLILLVAGMVQPNLQGSSRNRHELAGLACASSMGRYGHTTGEVF